MVLDLFMHALGVVAFYMHTCTRNTTLWLSVRTRSIQEKVVVFELQVTGMQ